METLIIIVFVIGYLAIALEHSIKINKTASAILTGVICWTLFAVATPTESILNSSQFAHFLNPRATRTLYSFCWIRTFSSFSFNFRNTIFPHGRNDYCGIGRCSPWFSFYYRSYQNRKCEITFMDNMLGDLLPFIRTGQSDDVHCNGVTYTQIDS